MSLYVNMTFMLFLCGSWSVRETESGSMQGIFEEEWIETHRK